MSASFEYTSNAQAVFDLLLTRYGPQGWWPGDSPLEIMLGAVLTQRTSWKNVERALANLKDAGVLSLAGLSGLSRNELEELLRPAGFYRQKAARVQSLLALIQRRYEGSLDALLAEDRDTLRETLLALNGIGPETADAIVLYAAGKASFVVDAYTHRVFKRHGWVEPEAGYEDLQQYLESGLPRDAAVYNEYHALLVQVGKDHCGTKPKCTGCPLESLLPPGGVCTGEDG